MLLLLTGIVFVMGMINSWFTPERTRALLAGRREGMANIMAATLGIFTPFCSCSAVPLFIGFVQAGVPLGVTFSFLISAPMVNEVALTEKMPVNLGNPGEFTMLELAEKVLQKLGSDLPITFMPLPQDDPLQRRPDISRAAELLDWQPTIGLDQGLDKTIAWFAQRLKSDRMKGSMVS